MAFLGFPVEIWLAMLLAVLIKLKYQERTPGILGYTTTIGIAVLSGLLLHGPVMEILSLSNNLRIPVAVLVSLTAEQILSNILAISSDENMLRKIVERWISKKTDGDK